MDSRATHWLSVLKGGAKVSDLSSRLALCVGDVPCRLVTGDKGMPVCELLDPGGKPIKKVVTLWWLIDTGCIQGWAGRLPNMSFWIDSPPKADGSRQRFVAEFRNKLPTLSRSELDVLLALLPDDREPANCSVAISCVSPCLAAAPVDLSFLDRGDRDKKNIERKYEAMPERFYGPGLDPVGPSKLESRVGDRLSESGSSSEPAPACRCDVWEWFSGTGWLSHWARGGGFKTGPPMDYRHGFDAQYPPPTHQECLLDGVCKPGTRVLFGAPSCSPWGRFAAEFKPTVRRRKRNAMFPSLVLFALACVIQWLLYADFLLDQPEQSDMFLEFPMCLLLLLSGVDQYVFSQCYYGAEAYGDTIKKDSVWVSTFAMPTPRCPASHVHGNIRGRLHGTDDLSALSGGYSGALCQEVISQAQKLPERSHSFQPLGGWRTSFPRFRELCQ